MHDPVFSLVKHLFLASQVHIHLDFPKPEEAVDKLLVLCYCLPQTVLQPMGCQHKETDKPGCIFKDVSLYSFYAHLCVSCSECVRCKGLLG